MPNTCPTCGREQIDQEQAASNSEREMTLTVPEHHWPIFKLMFQQMNIKFGMMGLGEFANILPSYDDQVPLDRSKFRYFDDTAVAYVFLAMERGYSITTRTEPGGQPDYEGNERLKVFADLRPAEGGEVRSLMISECAYEDVARDVCAYLEEASARYAPM
jgi:hypothetical protein